MSKIASCFILSYLASDYHCNYLCNLSHIYSFLFNGKHLSHEGSALKRSSTVIFCNVNLSSQTSQRFKKNMWTIFVISAETSCRAGKTALSKGSGVKKKPTKKLFSKAFLKPATVLHLCWGAGSLWAGC